MGRIGVRGSTFHWLPLWAVWIFLLMEYVYYLGGKKSFNPILKASHHLESAACSCDPNKFCLCQWTALEAVWIQLLWLAAVLLKLEPAQGSPRKSCGHADSDSAGPGWGLTFCISKEFACEETLWAAKVWREKTRSEGCGCENHSPLPTLAFHVQLQFTWLSNAFWDTNPLSFSAVGQSFWVTQLYIEGQQTPSSYDLKLGF